MATICSVWIISLIHFDPDVYKNTQDHSQDDPDDLHNPKSNANASNGMHIIGYEFLGGIEAPDGVNRVSIFCEVAGGGFTDAATRREQSSGGTEIGCVDP